MRTIALVVLAATAFALSAGSSRADDEYTIRKTLAGAGYVERVNTHSIATFCTKPRSNTPEKCRADYEDYLTVLGHRVAKQLEYLVAVKRGVTGNKLKALKKAWDEALDASGKSSNRLDDLYWFDTTASAGTAGQATK